jgi:hypothetical protein
VRETRYAVLICFNEIATRRHEEESMNGAHSVGVGLVIAGMLGSGGCGRSESPAPPPATTEAAADAPPERRVVGPLSAEDAKALATMNDRITEYVELHVRLERTLPELPKEATPEQIDQNQRALEKLVRDARAQAKPGDIFTTEARPVIKRLLATVFAGADGAELKASIMEDNPIAVTLAVNARYPDNVPISTIPPEVLQTLPELTEDLEYRFIGDNLILMDVHAHLVADFITDALPK